MQGAQKKGGERRTRGQQDMMDMMDIKKAEVFEKITPFWTTGHVDMMDIKKAEVFEKITARLWT